jgi:hypothetical protein
MTARTSTRTIALAAAATLGALTTPAAAQHTIEQGIAANLDEVVFFSIAGLVLIFLIIFTAVASMVKSSNREKTRRELAAYVAEGTITPQDAERLLVAEPKDD